MMMKIPSSPASVSWSPWTRFRPSMLGRPPRRGRTEAGTLQPAIEEPPYDMEAPPEAAPAPSAEIG